LLARNLLWDHQVLAVKKLLEKDGLIVGDVTVLLVVKEGMLNASAGLYSRLPKVLLNLGLP
jgi:hypothetical protein